MYLFQKYIVFSYDARMAVVVNLLERNPCWLLMRIEKISIEVDNTLR